MLMEVTKEFIEAQKALEKKAFEYFDTRIEAILWLHTGTLDKLQPIMNPIEAIKELE